MRSTVTEIKEVERLSITCDICNKELNDDMRYLICPMCGRDVCLNHIRWNEFITKSVCVDCDKTISTYIPKIKELRESRFEINQEISKIEKEMRFDCKCNNKEKLKL